MSRFYVSSATKRTLTKVLHTRRNMSPHTLARGQCQCRQCHFSGSFKFNHARSNDGHTTMEIHNTPVNPRRGESSHGLNTTAIHLFSRGASQGSISRFTHQGFLLDMASLGISPPPPHLRGWVGGGDIFCKKHTPNNVQADSYRTHTHFGTRRELLRHLPAQHRVRDFYVWLSW